MPTRHKGIIAYGTEEDREKLAVLAQIYGKSGSEVIVQMIRQRFKDVFGDADARSIAAVQGRTGT